MVSEITRFYCKPVMTSSSFLRQRSLYAILRDGFWKGDPDFIFMFNWHVLSILNGLDVFWRYSTFCIWLGFPYGAKFCFVFAKWSPKRQMREKYLLGGHFLTPNCVLWAIVREHISIRLACTGAQEKMQEGRKARMKKSQEVYISCMRGATTSGRIPTKLVKCVRLINIIKLAKFHRFNLRGFGVVRRCRFNLAI